MNRRLLALLAAVVGSTQAFVPPLSLITRTAATTASAFVLPPLQSRGPLDPVDEMCMENVAEFCLEDALACDVEEVDALVNQLQEQRAYHASQVDLLEDLLDKLTEEQPALNGESPGFELLP